MFGSVMTGAGVCVCVCVKSEETLLDVHLMDYIAINVKYASAAKVVHCHFLLQMEFETEHKFVEEGAATGLGAHAAVSVDPTSVTRQLRSTVGEF